MNSQYARESGCPPQHARKVSVEAALRGSGVEVNTASRIRSPYPVIWQTLTDYDHLAGFIPGILESRVVERQGSAAIVHQRGHASFLFLSVPLDVVVESLEEPPFAIGIRVLRGTLKRLDGGYRISEIPDIQDEYLLEWSGVIEPSIPIPMYMVMPFLTKHIEDQFLGMVVEIERRCAQITDSANSQQPSARCMPGRTSPKAALA